MTQIDIEKLRGLAREYRPTMGFDIVHSWGADVAAALPALLSELERKTKALEEIEALSPANTERRKIAAAALKGEHHER